MSASVVQTSGISNELECKQDEISPTLINKQQSTDLLNGYIKNVKLNMNDDIIIPHALVDLCFKFFYIDIQDLIDSKTYHELYQIASELYDSGYYTKAMLIVQHLMTQKPGIDDHIKDALILHIYALILDEYKDYKQSAIQYLRAISLDPKNNCIFANYALSLQEQHKFIEAETHFLSALELVDDVYDRHNLAKLYEKTKEYDKAEEQYKIICLNGERPNPTSVQYYADYLKRIEKYSDAAIQYKLVIGLLQEMENNNNNDNNKGICNHKKLMYLRLGICYKRLNKFVDAECALKTCLEIDKNYLLAHDHYAHWFYCQKRYDESLAYYKNIINMNPTDCDWYYWVALNLRELKQYNESVRYYKICLSMNPVSKNVNGSYSHCLYLMDKLDKALYYIDIAKKLDSDNEWTHYYHALLMRKLKKYKEANDSFKQCLKMNEKNHRCNYQYGLFLIEIKNKLKEALKHLEMAKNEEKDNQKYNDKYTEISKMIVNV